MKKKKKDPSVTTWAQICQLLTLHMWTMSTKLRRASIVNATFLGVVCRVPPPPVVSSRCGLLAGSGEL